jgi:hypothetical protein
MAPEGAKMFIAPDLARLVLRIAGSRLAESGRNDNKYERTENQESKRKMSA